MALLGPATISSKVDLPPIFFCRGVDIRVMQALLATMKDPESLADARRLNIEVNSISGGTLNGLLAELYATP